MLLPEAALNRLTRAGLLVSDAYVSNDPAFPSAVAIAKPASVPGNTLPGYEAWWSDDIPLDAPGLRLETVAGKWTVISHDCVPGPGPGDFVHPYAAIDDAIDDVLDFFFGDSSRMEDKANAAAGVSSSSLQRCLQQGCSAQPIAGYAFCSKHLDDPD